MRYALKMGGAHPALGWLMMEATQPAR